MNTAKVIEEFNDDDVFRYIRQWRDSEGYSDINLFLDKGYLDLAAKTLQEAGAIDSKNCYDRFKPIEKHIEKMLKAYGKRAYKKDLEEAMEGVSFYVHKDTNEHQFIDFEMYFITDAELRDWGYLPIDEHPDYKK